MKCKIPATLIRMATNNTPFFIVFTYLATFFTIGYVNPGDDNPLLSGGFFIFWSIFGPLMLITVLIVCTSVFTTIKKRLRDWSYYSAKEFLEEIFIPLVVIMIMIISGLLGYYGLVFSHLTGGAGSVLSIFIIAILTAISFAIVVFTKGISLVLIEEYKEACREVDDERKS